MWHVKDLDVSWVVLKRPHVAFQPRIRASMPSRVNIYKRKRINRSKRMCINSPFFRYTLLNLVQRSCVRQSNIQRSTILEPAIRGGKRGKSSSRAPGSGPKLKLSAITHKNYRRIFYLLMLYDLSEHILPEQLLIKPQRKNPGIKNGPEPHRLPDPLISVGIKRCHALWLPSRAGNQVENVA